MIQESAQWSLYKFRNFFPIFKQNFIPLYKTSTSPDHKCIELGLDIYPITFLIFGCEFIIRRRRRSSIVITFFLKLSCPSVSSKILNLSIWILFFTCIYEWERPNKNSEDNYEDRGFWDANYLNFTQQKTLLAYI